MYMTRGATGSAGYEQIRDKSTYYKNYYKNNKERLKRHKQKRIDQQKRQNKYSGFAHTDVLMLNLAY